MYVKRYLGSEPVFLENSAFTVQYRLLLFVLQSYNSELQNGKKRAASVLKYQWNKTQDLTDDVIFG